MIELEVTEPQVVALLLHMTFIFLHSILSTYQLYPFKQIKLGQQYLYPLRKLSNPSPQIEFQCFYLYFICIHGIWESFFCARMVISPSSVTKIRSFYDCVFQNRTCFYFWIYPCAFYVFLKNLGSYASISFFESIFLYFFAFYFNFTSL